MKKIPRGCSLGGVGVTSGRIPWARAAPGPAQMPPSRREAASKGLSFILEPPRTIARRKLNWEQKGSNSTGALMDRMENGLV